MAGACMSEAATIVGSGPTQRVLQGNTCRDGCPLASRSTAAQRQAGFGAERAPDSRPSETDSLGPGNEKPVAEHRRAFAEHMRHLEPSLGPDEVGPVTLDTAILRDEIYAVSTLGTYTRLGTPKLAPKSPRSGAMQGAMHAVLIPGSPSVPSPHETIPRSGPRGAGQEPPPLAGLGTGDETICHLNYERLSTATGVNASPTSNPGSRKPKLSLSRYETLAT
ncbi:hypothetical protein O1611_g1186 [Lasiodiplodia mahajangana]|uniref:Uncharacterized protein n=1 Tax=Lasiodiplodia mahajangana TaxID=1108764 RepID=A0ACC2JY78_9PEZI|nr:hypothetical protein O1611_g1186 [Lasiodiplodia mahajangana]